MTNATFPPAAILVPGEQFILAELHAMKLDGVLAAVIGEAFRSTTQEETPGHRAAALVHHIPAAMAPRAVLGQLSAAWVYGCAPPPTVIALLQNHEGKSASLPPFSGCTLRQVYLSPQEVLSIGGVLVTSPLRTALDVARTAPEALARAVLEALSRESAFRCSLGRIRQALQAATHVPGKLRGLDLVQGMIDADALRS
ncbi:hypothetical protein ART_0980 [Arthrobacter sp. PAMC 25486]|uniref:hypothetical protein n=1 Tax=Arthrobacter sp. PAMC 25486 TaxID=1494608 RepID=UPI000535C140|nr:hypothetical protein [Arthrobacter sp. PAMC 25486]AIY00579.1 hypothetical protein ART_0980 [Arthrobacter sp. PAMC 25486]